MSQLLPPIWWLTPTVSILGLLVAGFLYKTSVKSEETASPAIQELTGYIRTGAEYYLKKQYALISAIFMLIFIFFSVNGVLGLHSPFIGLAFITGGFLCGLSGYVGVKISTRYLNHSVSSTTSTFSQGAHFLHKQGLIITLCITGLSLFGITVWYGFLNMIYDRNFLGLSAPIVHKLGLGTAWSQELSQNPLFQQHKLTEMALVLIAFSFGASLCALFARIGSGIFAKASDTAANQVGKFEMKLKHDDLRNPAVLADWAGDHVTHVAGIGSLLFEACTGAIVATAAIGALIALHHEDALTLHKVVTPMIVAGGGLLISVILSLLTGRIQPDTPAKLMRKMLINTTMASVLLLGFVLYLVNTKLMVAGTAGAIGIGLAGTIGILWVLGLQSKASLIKTIAQKARMMPASLILTSLLKGMTTMIAPVIILIFVILGSFISAGGLVHVFYGMFGISYAAIAMLSLAIIPCTYHMMMPISDTTGGLAEATEQASDISHKIEHASHGISVGFQTVLTAGSVLSSFILILVYLETLKHWLHKLAESGLHTMGSHQFTNQMLEATAHRHVISTISLDQLISIFSISILNPQFLAGLLAGSIAVFTFIGGSIYAVLNVSQRLIAISRAEFTAKPGILSGQEMPNYLAPIEEATKGASKYLAVPALVAIGIIAVVGLFLGIAGTTGFLLIITVLTFPITLIFLITGTLIKLGSRWLEMQSDLSEQTIWTTGISDPIGDIFRDIIGPNLGILIKLLIFAAILLAGLVLKFGVLINV